MYDSEQVAKSRVTKNNKQYTFELLSGTTNREEYAYCTWAEFEQIAMRSKRKGYRVYHEF